MRRVGIRMRPWGLGLLLSVAYPVQASVVHVNANATGAFTGASWTDAFTDLQDALAVAQAGDQIWVAAGTYTPAPPGGSRDATFQLQTGVGLYGGFAGTEANRDERDPDVNITILSGDLAGDDDMVIGQAGLYGDPAARTENSYHVVTASRTETTAVLDGFVISGGYADGTQYDENARGGGMYNEDGSPTVNNCMFIRNVAPTAYGKGAGMFNLRGHPTLTNCTFQANFASGSRRGRGRRMLGRGGAMANVESSPTLVNCTFLQNAAGLGGAMLNQGSEPVLTDCTFRENAAPDVESFGGAMYDVASNSTLTDCRFIMNRTEFRGGGIAAWRSRPELIRCTFIQNTAREGGGMHNVDSHPAITHCTFAGNACTVRYGRGGAIYNRDGSSPVIEHCEFSGNSATYGGGAIYNAESRPRFTNCIFVANSAQLGGGVHSWQSHSRLVHCTFSENSAFLGAGILNRRSNPVVTNCILWGNRDLNGMDATEPIFNDDRFEPNTPVVNDSCIQGGWRGEGGIGIIDTDPMFVRRPYDGGDGWGVGENDDFGDLRLACGSPCIDAGDNTAVPPSITTDLDGNPRRIDGIVDMGAHEGANQAVVIDGDPVNVPEGGTATFHVALACDPLATINVTIAPPSGDADVRVRSEAALVFHSANFATPQPVILAAADDDDQSNGSATLRVTAPGIPYQRVTINEAENDVPAVLYVDAASPPEGDGTSWAAAFFDLRNALHVAAQSRGAVREIRVAAGTYTPAPPNGDRDATFSLMSGVGLYGGFLGAYAVDGFPGERRRDEREPTLNVTILSGDLNGDDGPDFFRNEENTQHVVTADATDSTAVLDGFVITGGASATSGGGMICINRASPTLRRCVFRRNSAVLGGGMYNGGASTLQDCAFVDNRAFVVGNLSPRAAGIYNGEETRATFVNCSFIRNRVTGQNPGGGGGILNRGSSVTLRGCVFTGNSAGQGAGIESYQSRLTLTNCTFIANVAEGRFGRGGGTYSYQTSPMLTNCRFSGNSAGFGGAAMFGQYNSSPILRNCTFSENLTLKSAGAIWSANGTTPTLTNCILWGNRNADGTHESAQISIPTGSEQIPSGLPVVEYSCIQGLTGAFGGVGNIGVDPRFVAGGYWDDAGTPDDLSDDVWVDGDDRLQPGSPCINAGDPHLAPPPDETDLAGNLRVQGGRLDMGAFETPWAQGDADFDGDVDLADFLAFAKCFGGAGEPAPDDCRAFDLDGDGDVDLADLLILQAVLTGAP